MRLLIALIMIFPTYVCADEKVYEIDISKCKLESCFNAFNKTFKVGENIKVVAWADVVDVSKPGTPSFYPLFNIYNEGTAKLKVEIGMQLLDKNRVILAERIYEDQFSPYNPKASQYEIYRSLNAMDLTSEIITSTKYVNVIVNRK